MMLSRRAVLQAGVLSAALPIAGRAAAAGFANEVGFDFLVVDRRLRESGRFADALGANGVSVLPTDGDVTDIWYRHLHPQWTRGAGGVAGLTGHDALFCLERLAWDHRLRLVYRADHSGLGDRKAHHAVHGYPDANEASRGLERAGALWPEYAALLVGQQSSRKASPLAATHVGVRVLSSGVEAAMPVYSWILAPIHLGKA